MIKKTKITLYLSTLLCANVWGSEVLLQSNIEASVTSAHVKAMPVEEAFQIVQKKYCEELKPYEAYCEDRITYLRWLEQEKRPNNTELIRNAVNSLRHNLNLLQMLGQHGGAYANTAEEDTIFTELSKKKPNMKKVYDAYKALLDVEHANVKAALHSAQISQRLQKLHKNVTMSTLETIFVITLESTLNQAATTLYQVQNKNALLRKYLHIYHEPDQISAKSDTTFQLETLKFLKYFYPFVYESNTIQKCLAYMPALKHEVERCTSTSLHFLDIGWLLNGHVMAAHNRSSGVPAGIPEGLKDYFNTYAIQHFDIKSFAPVESTAFPSPYKKTIRDMQELLNHMVVVEGTITAEEKDTYLEEIKVYLNEVIPQKKRKKRNKKKKTIAVFPSPQVMESPLQHTHESQEIVDEYTSDPKETFHTKPGEHDPALQQEPHLLESKDESQHGDFAEEIAQNREDILPLDPDAVHNVSAEEDIAPKLSKVEKKRAARHARAQQSIQSAHISRERYMDAVERVLRQTEEEQDETAHPRLEEGARFPNLNNKHRDVLLEVLDPQSSPSLSYDRVISALEALGCEILTNRGNGDERVGTLPNGRRFSFFKTPSADIGHKCKASLRKDLTHKLGLTTQHLSKR